MNKIIAVCGRKGSGKDTAADILIGYAGFERLKFADPLKMMLRQHLEFRGVDDDTIQGMLEGDLKEVPTEHFRGKTPRLAMQTLGTEWGRQTIGDDLWTDTVMAAASKKERVVITDARFLNEAAAVRRAGGVIIKIEAEDRLGANTDPHASEAEIPLIDADLVLENNGSLEDFLEQCRSTFEVIIENV